MTGGLSSFQKQVAQLFFTLPDSRGFLLAGGGALLATGLSTRVTKDLDFFGADSDASIGSLVESLIAHSRKRGWDVSIIQATSSFARLLVIAEESLVVDIGLDAPPISPVFTSEFGPTFALDELGARKLLALFDRAEARDFVDIFQLRTRFSKSKLVSLAHLLDDGFNLTVLAKMMRSISRFGPQDFAPLEEEYTEIVEYFLLWSNALLEGQ